VVPGEKRDVRVEKKKEGVPELGELIKREGKRHCGGHSHHRVIAKGTVVGGANRKI